MFEKLFNLANILDKKGFYSEASIVDVIIKYALSRNGIINALKKDDTDRAKKEFFTFISNISSYSTPAKELGLGDNEYREFANAVRNNDLEKARDIMGIGKDDLGKQHPWSSEYLDKTPPVSSTKPKTKRPHLLWYSRKTGPDQGKKKQYLVFPADEKFSKDIWVNVPDDFTQEQLDAISDEKLEKIKSRQMMSRRIRRLPRITPEKFNEMVSVIEQAKEMLGKSDA